MDNQIKAIIVTNSIAIALILVRELFSVFKDTTRNNTKAVESLNKSIVELQVQMEYVHKDLKALPELREKILEMHDKVQSIQIRFDEHIDRERER